MTQTPNTTRKLYHVGIVSLFLISIFATMTPAAIAAGPAPTLVTVERDYVTPTATVFGAGTVANPATVYVVVDHADSDRTDERDVFTSVSAASGANTIFFDLLETGPHTGKFIGSFGIVPAADTKVDPGTDATYGAVLGRTMGEGRLPAGATGDVSLKITKFSNDLQTVARKAQDGVENLAFADVTRVFKWIPSQDGILRGYTNQERCGTTETPSRTDRSGNACPTTHFFDLGSTIPGWDFKIHFTLVDKDRNLVANAADTTLIIAWSDSDAAGELVTLTETAIGSGVFEGQLGFESTKSGGNTLVFTQPGDQVYVNYIDPRDKNGVEQVPVPFNYLFNAQSNGVVSFSRAVVAGLYETLDEGDPVPEVQKIPGTRNRVNLAVTDTDRDETTGNEQATVQLLTPASGATPENTICKATLDQAGGLSGSGNYVATLMFDNVPEPADGTTACQNLGGVQIVPLGAVAAPVRKAILARYSDTDRTNTVVVREATVTWVPSTTATVRLGPSDEPQRFVGTVQSVNVLVNDLDSDQNPNAPDSIVVRVYSDSDSTKGVQVTLVEQTASSGIFTGTFSFNTNGLTTSTLFVQDLDMVQATFEDIAAADGLRASVQSAEAVWRAPKSATVSTDDTQYFYARRGPALAGEILCPPTGVVRPWTNLPCRPDTFARIFVEDQDQNDPRVRDEIRVQAVPIQPQSAIGAGVTVTLTEVGFNSGLFEGVLLFTEDPSDPDVRRLYVGDLSGDGRRMFHIAYQDPASANGLTASTPSANLLWRHITSANVRVVRFEAIEPWTISGQPGYVRHRIQDILGIGDGGGDTKTVVLTVYKAPGSAPAVEVSSERCPNPTVVTLPDGDGDFSVGGLQNDGRYALFFDIYTLGPTSEEAAPGVEDPTFEADPCSDAITGPSEAGVGVEPGNTITMQTGAGVEATAITRASASAVTKSFDPRTGTQHGARVHAFGEELPTMVETTAPDDNVYRFGRDVIVFQTRSLTDQIPRNIVAFESGLDTNLFKTSYLNREPQNFAEGFPAGVSVIFTNGNVIADALIPGPGGDTCSAGTASSTIPPDASISASGLGCIQLSRRLQDNSLETLAVKPTGTASVLLNAGFNVGSAVNQGLGRCSASNHQVVLAVPPVAGTVSDLGPFTCAQISIEGTIRYVLGEAWLAADKVDTVTTVRLTNGLVIEDVIQRGNDFGNTCGTVVWGFLGAAAPIDVTIPGPAPPAGPVAPADAIFTCIQITKAYPDGSVRTWAMDIRDGALSDTPVAGAGEPDVTNCRNVGQPLNSACRHELDPINITFYRGYLTSDQEGASSSTDAVCDPVGLAAEKISLEVFPDSSTAAANDVPVLTGTFHCIQIDVDPTDFRTTDPQGGQIGCDPDATPPDQDDCSWSEDPDFFAVGQRKILIVTMRDSSVSTDAAIAGELGSTCPSSGTGSGPLIAQLPHNVDIPIYPTTGSVRCVQIRARNPDGSSLNYAFPVTAGQGSVRLAQGFMEGIPGRDARCTGPTHILADFAARTFSAAPTAVTQIDVGVPTCAEITTDGKTAALGYDRKDGFTVLVRSDLQRNPLPTDGDPANNGFLAGATRSKDGIRLSGKGDTSYNWYDADQAQVSVQRDPVGSQGTIEVRITGDDILSGRVFEQPYTGVVDQRTFTVRQPYVPGSENLYDHDNSTGLGSDPARPEAASLANAAAESIYDRNRDGRWTCSDVNMASQGGATFSCSNTVPEGLADWGCSPVPCPPNSISINYQFRLAFRQSPGASPEIQTQYSRPNLNTVRLAECLPFGPQQQTCGAPSFSMDYTPAVKRVTIVSDSETETVDATWDQTLNPPAYRAIIPVEVIRGRDNDKINVVGVESTVRVRYDDPQGGDGRATPTNALDYRAVAASTLWRAGQDGVITFHNAGFTATSARVFGTSVPVRVQDSDADRTDQADAVVVRAMNAANTGEFVEVVLRESGVHTGFFQGYVPVRAGAANPTNGLLDMPDTEQGGNVRVIYEDRAGAIGSPSVPFATVPWQRASTATGGASGAIQLFNDQARQATDLLAPIDYDATTGNCLTVNQANRGCIFGEDEALFVSISDADANVNIGTPDKITAVLYSDGELTGETIELTERASAPGVFDSNAIGFERGFGQKNGLLFARWDGFQKDDIWVRYIDPTTEAGRSIASDSYRVAWRRTHDGLVDIEHALFFGTFLQGAVAAPGVRAFGTVIVTDQDCNTSPGVVDVISDGAACDLIPSAGPSLFGMKRIPAGGGTGADIAPPTVLRETGANTSVFIAPFSFRVAADDCADDGTPMTLSKCGTSRPVYEFANSEKIRASWADPVALGGGPASAAFFDVATWHEEGFGVLSFDKESYTDISEKPKLTLVDGDIGTVTVVDSVVVKLDTDVLSAPVDFTLTETGVKTGIFQRELTLSLTTATSAATGLIQIDQDDHLVAQYVDVAPPGTRSTSVPVNLLDKAAPVTTLTVAPDAVLGEHGVYKTTPTITLTAADQSDVKEIGFKLGASSVFTVYTGPFTAPAGRTVVTYRSIDILDHEETPKTTVIEVDLTDPTQLPTGFNAVPASSGRVKLNWTHVANTLDPFEFFEYAVYRDGAQAPIGNSTTSEYIDASLTDELSHTYQVAVLDKSGRKGPLTATMSVVPDATVPSLNAPIISPSGFDTRLPPTGVNVSITASDRALSTVYATMVTPAGEELDNQTLVLGPNGKYLGQLSVENMTSPCTCFLRIAAVDQAGNEATLSIPYIITGPDAAPPVATIPSGSLPVGSPLIVTVTDNVGVAKISYRFDDGVSVDVPFNGPVPVVSFEIPAALLSLGSHTVGVEMEDNATTETGAPVPNNSSALLAFTVVTGDGGGNLPPSFFLPTTARVLGNGSILVEWEVPSSLLGIAGFQVWRAASPFEPIANITSASQRSYIDSDVEPGTAYRYVATFFTSVPFASLADVPGYPGSDDAVPASAPVTAGGDGQPQWLWWVFGAIAVIAIAALLAILLAGRRGGGSQQEQVYAPAPPPAEAEAETQQPVQQEAWAQTHRLRCPQCSHRFEVSGTKPIVTNCPNCGRKGILR